MQSMTNSSRRNRNQYGTKGRQMKAEPDNHVTIETSRGEDLTNKGTVSHRGVTHWWPSGDFPEENRQWRGRQSRQEKAHAAGLQAEK